MNKLSKILTLLFILIFSVAFAACSNNGGGNGGGDNGTEPPNNEIGIPVISKNIANFTMNLDGAKQLGITTYANLTDTPIQKLSAQKGNVVKVSDDQEEDEDNTQTKERKDDEIVLVKIDEDGNVDEVELFEEEIDDEAAKTVDEYELEVYKMQVFGEFTAVAYISSYWRETQPDAVQWYHEGVTIYNRLKSDVNDTYNYRNNAVINSYLIHNATGKVYSTDAITGKDKSFHAGESFEATWDNRAGHDGFLRVCSKCYSDTQNCSPEDRDWYDLSINDEGELELKDLLPNKDFSVKHAVKDMYGWIYVATSSINEINLAKKIVYFTHGAYWLASNGKVYFGSEDIVPKAIYYGYATVMINGQPTPVSREDSFDTIRGDSGYMINGVYYYNGSLASGGGEYVIGVDCVNKTTVELSETNLPTYTDSTYGELTFLYHLYNIENIYSTEYRVWNGKNGNTGKWELYYIRISEYMYNEVTVIDVVECEILLDDVVLTSSGKYHYAKVSSQGTIIYRIIMGENGKPQIVESSVSNYESNMITIQPLN